MLMLIQSIHVELKGIYGSPRMVRELRDRGFPACKKRVERLMRENDIRAREFAAASASWMEEASTCCKAINPVIMNTVQKLDIKYITFFFIVVSPNSLNKFILNNNENFVVGQGDI